ncbi:GIY-YIG nuclease family protein [Chenggangzhangella methanolivorans]|uniref:GIY-YIG nuclease family protein n=1 Tax=Chenggangzhangella methanolivorans TaxID=1437009 RepID=A0A9E6R866_9HYPH|nr:GIY-YIG nuclease family protein [Chenggangzhangella methanolivorans]QZN99992.1 GIY-YIG nuclease family protein [Chenggangzhangella methanolivorans]
MAAYVYILASGQHGTLYVGVTTDLSRRIEQHRSGAVPGFTKAYGVTRLVYYEAFDSILEARARERTLKGWRRDWKTTLIESVNPDWSDLSATLA